MAACTECRRRKLRCSKEAPACKECRRLGVGCIYEARETKPGLKTGAVDTLNRRVDNLEKLLLQLQKRVDPADGETAPRNGLHGTENTHSNRSAVDVLLSFERELRNFNRGKNDSQQAEVSFGSSGHSTPTVEQHSLHSGDSTQSVLEIQRKRQRLDTNRDYNSKYCITNEDVEDAPLCNLPQGKLLDDVIECYFSQVHPWIPMIQQESFRERLLQQSQRGSLEVILHAMIVAALRFVKLDDSSSLSTVLQKVTQARKWVILHAMDTLTVENLQALIIVAFDDIGNGNAIRAWPIVACLTRSVEYLQLSTESGEIDAKPLLSSLSSLPSSKSWSQTEERRRVFWSIFNLDRLCSVITGWNTGITSTDIRLRLPVDGFLWRKKEQVVTPYFGIWGKSQNDNERPHASSDRMNTVGAFAYCIEATESLSRVTTEFLQQKIDLKDQKQIGRWLTSFKQLDLRLVHWKMFLPQKWKDANLSRQPTQIIMDPNLTLAHITHNVSTILLHQLIAYPPLDWPWAARLPSRYSADTCKASAIETSSITRNYLANPANSEIVNSQFVFCLFVTARSLLVHWRYYLEADPSPEFYNFVQSLETISSRWEGCLESEVTPRLNFARKCVNHLRFLYDKCTKDERFRIDVLGYVNEIGSGGFGIQANEQLASRLGQTEHADRAHFNSVQNSEYGRGRENRRPVLSPIGLQRPSTPYTQLPGSMSSFETAPHYPSMNDGIGTFPVGHNGTPSMTENLFVTDDLESISQMFLDQQFLDMDRVITYDDGIFAPNMEWWDQNSDRTGI